MLYFVGVGPGDPELVTLKAARLMREADAIALPDGGSAGAAERIAAEWIAGKPVLKLETPMRGGREDWRAAHAAAAEKLLQWLERYPTMVYPVLGDPGVFASSSYLHRLVAPKHPCEVVPGVPAMCAAAAKLGVPLCEKDETLTVEGEWRDGALPGGTSVWMKCARSLSDMRAALAGREAYVVRNLGMDGEFAAPLDAPEPPGTSYFTTVIVKNPEK